MQGVEAGRRRRPAFWIGVWSMGSSNQAPKHFWLPELLALLLAALCTVWAIREHVWPVSLLILALAVTMVVRNRKARFGVPTEYAGLAISIVAVIFTGPFLIVLAAIFRPQIVLPTVLAVTCVYAVIALFGAQIRRRGLR